MISHDEGAVMAEATTLKPGARAAQTLTLNMKLLGHHEIDGFGGIGV